MKIVFMGTPQAAVPSAARLLQDGHEIVAVYTQPDRPSGRGHKIVYSPIKEFALAHGISVFQPLKIKTSEALAEFRSHAADVAVIVAYGRILPEGFLNAFRNGAINVHFSLLPKYRGAAPVNWAIVNGETKTGVTTMRMDAGLDTGDVLLQSKTPIFPDETSIELMERLSVIGAETLSETLANLNSISAKKQDNTFATFAPMMKREDGLINWSINADTIADRIRGFQTFPASFTTYDNKKLTIWRASVTQAADISTSYVGEIIEAHGDTLHVACGNGSILSIIEIQPEGKRRMPIRDFLNGVKLKAGERLG